MTRQSDARNNHSQRTYQTEDHQKDKHPSPSLFLILMGRRQFTRSALRVISDINHVGLYVVCNLSN